MKHNLIKEYHEHLVKFEIERAQRLAWANTFIYVVIGGLAIIGVVFLSMCGVFN